MSEPKKDLKGSDFSVSNNPFFKMFYEIPKIKHKMTNFNNIE